MKTFLSIALAIILLASVQSCSDNGLAGSWLGAPTRINIGGTADASGILHRRHTSHSETDFCPERRK